MWPQTCGSRCIAQKSVEFLCWVFVGTAMSDTDSESSDAHWAHRARKTMKSIMGNFAVAEDMFLDEVAAIAVAAAAAEAAEPITDGRSTSSSHKGWSKKRKLVKSLSETQDNKGKKKGKSKQKGKELTDIGSSVGKGNDKEKGKHQEKGKRQVKGKNERGQ